MSQDMRFRDIKPGDYAKCFDSSYSLKIMRDRYGYPTWMRCHDYNLIGDELKVVETDLKVPNMANDLRRVDLDADDKPIYLDTMIRDGSGGYWLVQGRFLEIQNS